MGRLVADSFDIKGNTINVEQKQHLTNPLGSAIPRNIINTSFAPQNDKQNLSWSSVSSIYGRRLSNCSKFSNWSKYSFASGSSIFLDLCGEEDCTDVLFDESSKDYKLSIENSSEVAFEDEKEDYYRLRVVNEENITDDNKDNEGESENDIEEDSEEEDNDHDDSEDSYHDIESLYDGAYESYLHTGGKSPIIYRCHLCYSDICHSSQIISKDFWGNNGRAYFVKKVINVKEDGYKLEKTMRTGDYTITSILCAQCNFVIGWKYLSSVESSERYKINKYVIEEKLLKVYNVSLPKSSLIHQ